MKKNLCRAYLTCILPGLILLTGCAVEPKKPEAAPKASAPASPEKTPPLPRIPEQKSTTSSPPVVTPPLTEGIELYDKGDYNGAVKLLLGANDIWTGDIATQVTALKYIAFSYCVTGRQNLCRQQFEKAFKLEPNFDLAPGEKGHPLWGPAFDRAKKTKK